MAKFKKGARVRAIHIVARRREIGEIISRAPDLLEWDGTPTERYNVRFPGYDATFLYSIDALALVKEVAEGESPASSE